MKTLVLSVRPIRPIREVIAAYIDAVSNEWVVELNLEDVAEEVGISRSWLFRLLAERKRGELGE